MWAKAHSALGLMYAEQRDYARAESALRKTVDIDPSNTEALFNLAKVYELTARPALAAQTYLAILEIEPEDIEALHNLGIIYVKDLKDPERARSCLTMALRLNPEYDQAAVARKILSQIGRRP
jgi:tetratricopeptide (TPR) repeat protein